MTVNGLKLPMARPKLPLLESTSDAPHQPRAAHTPTTMPTLLMTAITVVRQRSDICMPRMAAKAATMINMPGRMSTASGKTIHWKVGSFQSLSRRMMS